MQLKIDAAAFERGNSQETNGFCIMESFYLQVSDTHLCFHLGECDVNVCLSQAAACQLAVSGQLAETHAIHLRLRLTYTERGKTVEHLPQFLCDTGRNCQFHNQRGQRLLLSGA